ncbi:MAG: hypothetical protein JNK29_07880, partial [Anaerolineales bacterium]|nr:hypothetical protein [Anaerolineales bacterium]
MSAGVFRSPALPGAHLLVRVASAAAILISALAGALPPAAVRPALARSIGPWSDTSTADFAGCTTLTNISVTNAAGGELRLAAAVEDDFDGTALNTTRWTSGRVYTWGGSAPTLAGGRLTLDSAYIRSQASLAAGARAMEFRARLRASAQDTGWGSFGLGRQSQPYGATAGFAHRLFETDNVSQLYATSRDGSAAGAFPTIAGVDLTAWHTYRVEWGAAATQYFIDGVLQQTFAGTAATSAWAWFYTADPGSQVQVDWVRVAPYPASGEFISCAVDAEETTTWGTLALAADTPAGTAVAAETRTSADNANWSAWTAVGAGGQIASPAGRFLQYRLTFSTANPLISPEVRQVVVTPQTGWRHTALADFNQTCAVAANTSVADVNGGEVRLAAAVEDYFYNPQIDYTRWITGLTNSASGVPPVQASGVITLNASYLRSTVTVTEPVRTFEARARLRVPPPNTAWGDIGFGRQSTPGGADAASANRLFITTNTNLVQANARTGSPSPVNSNLPDVDPALWHLYRIQWTPTNTYYFVDGAVRVTDTVASAYAPYVWLYTLDPGSQIEVDWLRVDAYPASGTYQSCSFDAGQTTGWGALAWGGSTPAGTAVSFETRASPDGVSWSAWSALGAGNAVLSPAGRYLQYRAALSTSDSTASPQVDWVQVAAAGALPAVISGVSAAAATLPVQISAATDRLALARVQYGQTPALGTWLTGTEYLTSHTFALTGLPANTLYYYAVYAATPEGLESQSAVGTFTTPAGSLTQSTAAEFGQGASCSTLTNALIANAGGGEVRLRSTTLEDYFGTDGFFDTSQWVGRTITPSGPYTPTVAGGVVQVVSDTVGARIRSVNTYSPGQTIEFRAAYDPARYERIGFSDFGFQW